MEFTKEQFEEIGPWHFHDLCFDSSDQDFMLKIFNLLPSHLQSMAVSWGCDDSVFRDDAYEYLLDNQFNMTCEEYRNSEIGKEFFKNRTYQTFNFDLLKPKNIVFDIETGDDIYVMYEGVIDKIKLETGIQKLDEIMSGGLKMGELGIIMAPAGVGKYNPLKGRYNEKIQEAINKYKKKDA